MVKQRWKRTFSLVLSAAMVWSMSGVSALAEDLNTPASNLPEESVMVQDTNPDQNPVKEDCICDPKVEGETGHTNKDCPFYQEENTDEKVCICDPKVEGETGHTNKDCPFYQEENTNEIEEAKALIEKLPSLEEINQWKPTLELTEEDEGYQEAYDAAVFAHREELRKQIQEARAAYDALDEEQKKAFDQGLLSKLTSLETKLSQPVIDMESRLSALPSVEEFQNWKPVLDIPENAPDYQTVYDAAVATHRKEVEEQVNAVREAYDILTSEQQAVLDPALVEKFTALEAVLLPALMSVADPKAVYVSNTGSDEDNQGNGSKETPYASLAKAVDKVENGGTIYVMSDLTSTACARIVDKNITITSGDGGPYTIIRGDKFDQIQDNARSTYNPAMIEVTTPSGQGASLTLTNIILDDAGKHEGTIFAQASKGNDNTKYVQDGIIAAYGLDSATASIILEQGAVLKNFGGMSAVRVTGGAELTMRSGSKICDDAVNDRIKGGAGSNGPAGAVWVQGTNATMEAGAEISNMVGRAFYVDGGGANISGTIRDITGDKDMWWAGDGIAVHGRNSAVIELTNSSLVEDIYDEDKKGDNERVIYATNAGLKLGGTIQKCTAMNIVSISGGKGGKACTISGIIQNNMSDTNNGYTIACAETDLTISDSAYIRGNKSGVATVYAAAGAKMDLFGHIDGNTGAQCGGIFMYGNYSGGRDITVDMYEGATLDGNMRDTKGFQLSLFDKLKDRGGAVCCGGSTHGCNTIFTIHGGTISNNKSSYGALCVRKNGQAIITGTGKIINNIGYGVHVSSESSMPQSSLVMENGTISGNTKEGIYYSISSNNYVKIKNGVIINNGTDYQISATGGSAQDAYENIYINKGVLVGNSAINTSFGTVILDEDDSDVWLGTASTAAKEKLTKLVAQDPEHANWKPAKTSALWLKSDSGSYHFQVDRSTEKDHFGLYLAYIPLNTDGTPKTDAQLTLEEVGSEDIADVTLKGLADETAYAIMLFNTDTYQLQAKDLKIYTGEKNYSDGLPNDFTISGVGKIQSIKIGDSETKYSSYSTPDQERAQQDLKDLFNVNYQKNDGTPLMDDRTPGEYSMILTRKDANAGELRINGNTVNLVKGKLIIRYIDETDEVISGKNVNQLLDAAPTEEVTGYAQAVKATGDYYINDDSNRKIADTSGISLLDDGLLPSGNDGWQVLMEQRGNEIIQWEKPEPEMVNHYDWHYLDLVDQNNGNAWVSSQNEIAVYLPYPDGTDKTTDFKLLHYQDLHREYGIAGQADAETAIKNTRIEEITFTKEDVGIKFMIPRSGFSPFALVWQGEATTTPEPEDPDHPGSGENNDTNNTNNTNTSDEDSRVPHINLENIKDKDVPLEDLPENNLPEDDTTIDDGEVPLKPVPDTGDMIPVAAMAAAALSLGGVIVLSRKRK
ncbi:doubled motif LPXTG anchor domain-containing protein [Negativibacillus massiliensis]|uniref:doubled motif LPXTG anchor domain-containing protein n=1 Tax=Negativibacillus massiliensis TaxID=1871035 RepID=UPI003AF26BC8